MKCGLLGEKLGHSYSPQIHSFLGEYSYELFEKKPEELDLFLKEGEFDGLNVTIPYKKAVIPYCTELSPVAKQMGAVNTIVRRKDGSLLGHNTDFSGFRSMVHKSGVNPKGKKCLVLGSGGASATVQEVLKFMGATVIVISRSGVNNYSNLHLHSDAALIVNATPVGMYPNVGERPVDLALFPHLEGVLDLIYNPARTQLLLDAEERGLVAMNGLWMLVAQAKESAEWFTGSCISHEKIPMIHTKLRRQMENIVLIGMPGSGKSTVAAALAARLGKNAVDSDDRIVENAGCSIPEIFKAEGETAFRMQETAAISQLGKSSGLVIATGGGCVTQERNYPHLHQNGTIFCLQRNISKLSAEGRPLSAKGNLEEMYRIRKPMYHRFTDHFIDNNGSIEDALEQILSIWEAET